MIIDWWGAPFESDSLCWFELDIDFNGTLKKVFPEFDFTRYYILTCGLFVPPTDQAPPTPEELGLYTTHFGPVSTSRYCISGHSDKAFSAILGFNYSRPDHTPPIPPLPENAQNALIKTLRAN
jgi:hypothetical protein